MKRKLIAFLFLPLIISSCGEKNAKTETFKVWGNCGMCKETIENSLKIKGIIDTDWNKTSKIIRVTYDTTVTGIEKIHECIAAVGYDTEKIRGNDTAYAQLHECCQYDRKKE